MESEFHSTNRTFSRSSERYSGPVVFRTSNSPEEWHEIPQVKPLPNRTDACRINLLDATNHVHTMVATVLTIVESDADVTESSLRNSLIFLGTYNEIDGVFEIHSAIKQVLLENEALDFDIAPAETVIPKKFEKTSEPTALHSDSHEKDSHIFTPAF